MTIKAAVFALEKLALAMWTGALWMTGFVVAPVTFHVLSPNRALAGTLAGKLFSIVTWAGLAITTLMLVALMIHHARTLYKNLRFYLVALMGTLLCVNQFVLHPMIAGMRQQSPLKPGMPVPADFELLHRLASMDYVAVCILALALLIDKLRCNR